MKAISGTVKTRHPGVWELPRNVRTKEQKAGRLSCNSLVSFLLLMIYTL